MTETLGTLARVSPLQLKPEITALLQDPTLENVRTLLQSALELEHATIPPYLYALYSLGTASNQDVAGIIHSVVMQEMLHMNLAANVLNAIGGSPVLDTPQSVPHYPGPLPGMVQDQLTVHLAPASIPTVRNTFLVIEQPENPLEFPIEEALTSSLPLTIGQFYRGISKAIGDLGAGIFTGDPSRQVIGIQGAIKVTDVASAQQAIDIIVEQGEGTEDSPQEQYGPDLAHYYRFSEIVVGRRLVKNPNWKPGDPVNQKYVYGSETITLDESQVFPVPTDPGDGQGGTAGQKAIGDFNHTYTSLLKNLHDGFNGNPDVISGAIGIMFSLKRQAIAMMSGQSTNGVNVGPTFRWQPTPP
jgi:hypothetical protein